MWQADQRSLSSATRAGVNGKRCGNPGRGEWQEVWRCSLGVGPPSFGLMGTTSKYRRTPPHEKGFFGNGVPPQKEEEKKKSYESNEDIT